MILKIIRVLIVTTVIMILNLAMAYLWVWFYIAFVDPGHDAAYYETYAMKASIWSALIVGGALLLAGGWVLARWQGGGWRSGIWAGIAYSLIDIVLMFAYFEFVIVGLLSWGSKILLSAFGGQIAAGPAPATTPDATRPRVRKWRPRRFRRD